VFPSLAEFSRVLGISFKISSSTFSFSGTTKFFTFSLSDTIGSFTFSLSDTIGSFTFSLSDTIGSFTFSLSLGGSTSSLGTLDVSSFLTSDSFVSFSVCLFGSCPSLNLYLVGTFSK